MHHSTAGAIGSQVYVAMIATVAVGIGAGTVLVRLVSRPVEGEPATVG